MTFERKDGIWISDTHRDRIPQLCARSRPWPDTGTAFCPKAVLRKSICTSEPFQVILSDTLFLRSKLIFTFESAATYRLLYMKVATFSRKMQLKLIHFKSFNNGVTWSRFKYFPLLATFAVKLIHFCTSYCSFSQHLPHIELQFNLDERS